MTAPAHPDAAIEPNAPDRAEPTRAPLGWRARVALVLLPMPLLLLASELLLMALGLGREPGGQVAMRGFDPDSALLLPDSSAPGAWRTNIGLPKETVVPPKSARRRVLLMGGSNTQAFSRRDLLDDLEAAEPGGWEVFNLGRSGYGARRVRNLLAQALVLEPDVVVLYSGHNEFIERVFEQELEQIWGEGGGWMAALADGLSQLRTFAVLEQALSPSQHEPSRDASLDTSAGASPGASPGATPAASHAPPPLLTRTPPEGRQIPWTETLRYHAAYRQHVEAMLELCREAGAQVVLCTPLGNPMVPPISSTWPEDADPAVREQYDSLRFEAQSHMPPATRAAFHPPVRLRPPDWKAHVPPRAEPPSVTLRPLHPDLTAFIAAGGVGWPDATRWSDGVLTVLRTVELYVDPQLTIEERDRLDRARGWLDEAVALAPEQPNGWFDLGLVCLLQGDVDAAIEAFANARAWDRSPGAVSLHTNGILRELAGAHPEVTFVDSEAWFTERSPDGLVGYELLTDACHLQPGARTAFLRQLAAALLAMPRE